MEDVFILFKGMGQIRAGVSSLLEQASQDGQGRNGHAGQEITNDEKLGLVKKCGMCPIENRLSYEQMSYCDSYIAHIIRPIWYSLFIQDDVYYKL